MHKKGRKVPSDKTIHIRKRRLRDDEKSSFPYVYKLPSQYGPGIHPIPFQTDIPRKSGRIT